ncbi:MAG: hypothetical protein J7556_13515 [Acidovorax sp.]|nr:hypothetical protein [Acidovorax sp.]
MGYFICTTNLAPCPTSAQVQVSEITLDEIAAMGITPQSISLAVGMGFALVLSLAMLGYGLGVVLRMIRKV